jgi:alpha-tubulin suppressor-like RCC1 family protein
MGELGDGTLIDPRSTPVSAGVTSVLDVAVGHYHTCALQTGGVLRCWGANSDGQLGNGINDDSLTAAFVVGYSPALPAAVPGAGRSWLRALALLLAAFGAWRVRLQV